MRRLLPTPAAASSIDAYDDLVPPDARWVVLGMVGSLDGAATVDGRSGALGGQGDLAGFRALRTLADVVLVGAGTVRAEDYGPARPRAVERRRARGQGDAPRIAVVTGSGELDPDARLFADPDAGPDARALVVTTTTGATTARQRLGDRAEVVAAGDGRVDLARALDLLAERGLRRVAAEGGPGLNAQLLQAGLVDELLLTLAPSLVGDAGPSIVAGALDAPVDLVLHELRVHGSELLLRYRVLAPR